MESDQSNISSTRSYESFICKSLFLHSSSRAIKKTVRLGRSLYNTLLRGIGTHYPENPCVRPSAFIRELLIVPTTILAAPQPPQGASLLT